MTVCGYLQNAALGEQTFLPSHATQFFALGQMEVTSKMIRNFQSGAGAAGPYGYIINLGPGGGK